MTDRLGYERIERDHDFGACWKQLDDIVSEVCGSCASEGLHETTHHMTCECGWADRGVCDFCGYVPDRTPREMGETS